MRKRHAEWEKDQEMCTHKGRESETDAYKGRETYNLRERHTRERDAKGRK